ncbi:MAG TPA: FAD-dependent oxidoreductase, partial [Saprospiraceae bacterium]|nr:FAD-dependent oxidoreductase [Saprospiraceae bacterium]
NDLNRTMNREANLQRLQNEAFDLCIIGGGASGAGCALDAALRGLKVALIEKTDFAAETSSKSTKLIHGGVRYLEQAFKKLDFAQLRQVRHGLEERHIVLQNAPHLARPLALITPVFHWWENLYFSIGLALYGWFASGKDNLPKSRRLSKAETLRKIPGLTGKIHSAVQYYDGQLDDARYCLALVQSAAEAGAVVVNHLEVVDFQKDEVGQLLAAKVNDTIHSRPNAGFHFVQHSSFIIQSKLFLNCGGPFADKIRLLANPALAPRIRPSKGVHVVLPHAVLGSDEALLIPKTKDGRVVFAIPFEGEVLLGTTDGDFEDIDKEPVLEAREVDFLMETLQPFLKEPIEKKYIKAGFGGLRPLVISTTQQLNNSTDNQINNSTIQQTKSLLRDHEVEHDPVSNLFSLLGGKWTTYRLMAKDMVDAVCNNLGIQAACSTETHTLVGGKGWDGDFWKKISAKYGFDPDISQHLALKYGVLAHAPADLAVEHPVLAERILPGFPYLKAEVVYAVREEMACTLRDFLARRIRLEITDWEAAIKAAPVVAAIMGSTLGWTADQQQNELAGYTDLLEQFKAQANGNHTER